MRSLNSDSLTISVTQAYLSFNIVYTGRSQVLSKLLKCAHYKEVGLKNSFTPDISLIRKMNRGVDHSGQFTQRM